MTSNTPTATQGTTAAHAYAQQALHALRVTRDALNDEDPAGIDIALRTADVYARLAQAAATAEIAAVLHTHTTSELPFPPAVPRQTQGTRLGNSGVNRRFGRAVASSQGDDP